MGKLACGIWTDLLLKTVVIVYGMPLWSSISTICRQFFLSCACLRVVKSPKFWVAKSAFIVLDQVVSGLLTGCFRCLGGLNIVAYWALVWTSPGLDLGTCPNRCNLFYRHEFNWDWALTHRAPEDLCIGLVYSVMCTKQSCSMKMSVSMLLLHKWVLEVCRSGRGGLWSGAGFSNARCICQGTWSRHEIRRSFRNCGPWLFHIKSNMKKL